MAEFGAVDEADFAEASGAVGAAVDVEDDLDGCGELAVQGGAVHSAQGGKGFQAGGDFLWGVCVDCAGAAVVAGVQRGQ